jgi:hypothetical protein
LWPRIAANWAAFLHSIRKVPCPSRRPGTAIFMYITTHNGNTGLPAEGGFLKQKEAQKWSEISYLRQLKYGRHLQYCFFPELLNNPREKFSMLLFSTGCFESWRAFRDTASTYSSSFLLNLGIKLLGNQSNRLLHCCEYMWFLSGSKLLPAWTAVHRLQVDSPKCKILSQETILSTCCFLRDSERNEAFKLLLKGSV